jgi:hypothetical protein
MSRWFRFYDDTVNDPKVLRLSDELYRAWTILLCFASKHEGKLPPADDIAIALRAKPAKVCEWITKLVKGGLIDQTETGFEPHNWNGRQYKTDVTDPTAAERMKRYRKNKRNERNATVTVTRPEAETEQIQSRADARGESSVSEKILRTDLMEAFGPSRSPDLSRASVWLSKGYSTTLILEVVKDGLARKPDIATLNYFDAALAEKHANQPERPSEKASSAANIDMDKVAKMFKETGVWSRYAGPEPGMLGCKCPPEILAKHGIVVPGVRRMDA